MEYYNNITIKIKTTQVKYKKSIKIQNGNQKT